MTTFIRYRVDEERRTPVDRFPPLSDDHPLVGEDCVVCWQPFEAGQRPTLFACGPTSLEAAKKGRRGALVHRPRPPRTPGLLVAGMKMPRGKCDRCGKDVAIRKDGKVLGHHGPDGQYCDGSRKPPAVVIMSRELTARERAALEQSCRDSGVPIKVTDPVTIAKVVALLGRS